VINKKNVVSTICKNSTWFSATIKLNRVNCRLPYCCNLSYMPGININFFSRFQLMQNAIIRWLLLIQKKKALKIKN